MIQTDWRAFANADINDFVENHAKVVIRHSDRGSQCNSEMFREFFQTDGVTQSMSRTANYYDDASTERFWATLKIECFDNFPNEVPMTQQEVKQKIFRYIEVLYN